ncbi:MAG: hypothetical protein GY854_18740 [Deltaproteobacteria bacterium]|nr:hypothetical protein [Deltaproteobacteria bacterium]
MTAPTAAPRIVHPTTPGFEEHQYGECDCHPNYWGAQCENLIMCNEIMPTDPDVRNFRLGECVGPDVCVCPPMVSGEWCQFDDRECGTYAFNSPSVCYGRGDCVWHEQHGEFRCVCYPEYKSWDTFCYHYIVCFGQPPTLACNGEHGDCIADDTRECEAEYSGEQCEIKRTCHGVVFDDPLVCSGHGTCTDDDVCDCDPGFGGPNCSGLCH